MKIFNKFIWSKKEPSNKKDIWFDGSTWRIYTEEAWQSFTLPVDAADKVAKVLENASEVYQEKLTAGKGIKIENNTISTTSLYSIVQQLPEYGEDNVIYLVSSKDSEDKNIFIEYIWVNNQFEKLGEFKTKIDLTPYAKVEDVENINKQVITNKSKINLNEYEISKCKNTLSEHSTQLTELSEEIYGVPARTETFGKDNLVKGKCYGGYAATLEEAQQDVGAWYSNVFPVTAGQIVHVITDGNNNVFPAVILADENGKVIETKQSSIYGELDDISDFDVPEGIAQIAVNCYMSNIDNFILTITTPSTGGGLVAEVERLNGETLSLQESVQAIEEKLAEGEEKVVTYDKTSLKQGQCYNYGQNLEGLLNDTSTAASWYSNLFQVKEGQLIHIVTDGNSRGIPAVMLFDESGALIDVKWSNTYNQLDEIEDFVIPSGVTQMTINCFKTLIDDFSLIIIIPALEESNNTFVMPMEGRNVVFAGSSNVWGDGMLFYSYLNKPIEWLFQSTGRFTPSKDVDGESVRNAKKFLGAAKKISGVGSKVAFKHRGSELHICQAIERTSNYALIGVYADGQKVAEFTNENKTIGNASKTFVGDGETLRFDLDRCFTYGHTLTINGAAKVIKLNTGGYGATIPSDVDCMVARALDNDGNVIHTLLFKTAPASGATIVVNYKYGETIAFVKSSVGETEDGTLESTYAIGDTVYDPTNPVDGVASGVDFRYVDERAFYSFHFDTDKERNIELRLEGGTNPYFIFNFASSVYHNIMNAGIGGYTAKAFNATERISTNYRMFAQAFTPDFVSIGLTGNDDWDVQNFKRSVTRVVEMSLAELREYPSLEIGKIEYANGKYNVTLNTGVIDGISRNSLTSQNIIGSDVAVGEYVRIGTYTGDLRQVQTRKVTSVDLEKGVIEWEEPLHEREFLCIDSLQDLIGQDFSVRAISGYVDSMVDLIKNVRKITPKAKVCLFNVYYVDMWNRNTAEYTYIQQWIASQFDGDVFFVDAAAYNRAYEENAAKTSINVTADGSNETKFTLPFTYQHGEGFEVWVNGRNVYGVDCVFETGWKYVVNQSAEGAALNYSGGAYLRPVLKNGQAKMIWKKNAPSSGTSVVIKVAKKQWSGDYAHPADTDAVGESLGRAMIYALQRK